MACSVDVGAELPRLFGSEGWADRFVPFVSTTASAGTIRQRARAIGFWMSEMMIGPGFICRLDQLLSMRFTYGVPLQRAGFTSDILHSQFSAALDY